MFKGPIRKVERIDVIVEDNEINKLSEWCDRTGFNPTQGGRPVHNLELDMFKKRSKKSKVCTIKPLEIVPGMQMFRLERLTK